MSDSRAFMHNVLADILNQQDIPDSDADIDPERIREALTTGPGFDETEARILWASPLVRAEYREIRDEIQAGIRERCQARGLTLRLEPMRAAFAADRRHRLPAPDGSFQVDLLHTGDPDAPWIIQLHLNDRLRELLGDWHRLHLRLLDSGGHEWLCQPYDGETVLLQDWKAPQDAPDEGPDDRMLDHAVQLLIE